MRERLREGELSQGEYEDSWKVGFADWFRDGYISA